ncbi:hypothetical protein JIQ42_06668 [Leishmania sp. Namibia]|uniref:hypothetical protein n=1 Tax=Leishmania sp. Namibia TaxID=2802991 RepID=UPI001B4B072F|nr:hypothetical protein JIQ42_06668 [Leishmania sp. Namibia]
MASPHTHILSCRERCERNRLVFFLSSASRAPAQIPTHCLPPHPHTLSIQPLHVRIVSPVRGAAPAHCSPHPFGGGSVPRLLARWLCSGTASRLASFLRRKARCISANVFFFRTTVPRNQQRKMLNTALSVQDVDEIQSAVDRWYRQSSSNLQASHAAFVAQLRQLQEHLGVDPGAAALSAHTDAMITPPRHMYLSDDNNSGSPPMASPPVSRGQLNYDHLLDEVVGKGASMPPFNPDEEADRRRRPNAESVRAPSTPPEDCNGPCQVLVEFKRKRILQYESPYYVAPGEHVVVGGDRGEDIGLVTHTWRDAETHQLGENRDKGIGKVLRVASVLEVTQLQGVQTELETRAVEVAQEKVQESGLPMRIVDAEYQFDRRKLTFYYQSMHRLDFRTLVRDLYKTFRARIWMEPDTSS